MSEVMSDQTPQGWLIEVSHAKQIWDMIVSHEGIIHHMYLDTHGLVTVGVGILIPSQGFAISYPFVDAVSREPASTTEIATEYSKVSRQKPGLRAALYARWTHLELPMESIRREFDKIVTGRCGSLRKMYPGFNSFPVGPQLALLDMIFQLGPGGLRSNWPSLNKAVAKRDWSEASRQSHRRESSAARNLETSELFLSGTKTV